MSSPMIDMIEHWPIEIDKDGSGPAVDGDCVAVVCACGEPDCVKFMNEYMIISRANYDDLVDTAFRYDKLVKSIQEAF